MRTLAEQIRCVERELVMRSRVYPSRVERKQMSQQQADRETDTMRAVLATLKLCDQLADCLDEAPRVRVMGDMTEGATRIEISETLAKQIAAQLRGG